MFKKIALYMEEGKRTYRKVKFLYFTQTGKSTTPKDCY